MSAGPRAAAAAALLLSAVAADAEVLRPGDGRDVDTLPQSVLDGLTVDERVLACAAERPDGVVDVRSLAFDVFHVDLDGDPAPDWLVAGRDPCLRMDGGVPWWGYAGRGDDAGDGPPRVLRTVAQTLEPLDTRRNGFRELAVGRDGHDLVARYDGERYRLALPDQRPVPAGNVVVADLDRALPMPAVTPAGDARRRIIEQVLGGRDAEDATLNSVAHGAFTEPGADEVLYVVQPGGPRAAHSRVGERAVVIARYADGRLQQRYELAADAGHFIVATPDLDGDGRHEVLMRDDAYQMGVHITGLVLLGFDESTVERLFAVRPAREDGCDGPPLTREIRAARVEYDPRLATDDEAAYRVEWRTLACDGAGDGAGD